MTTNIYEQICPRSSLIFSNNYIAYLIKYQPSTERAIAQTRVMLHMCMTDIGSIRMDKAMDISIKGVS